MRFSELMNECECMLQFLPAKKIQFFFKIKQRENRSTGGNGKGQNVIQYTIQTKYTL